MTFRIVTVLFLIAYLARIISAWRIGIPIVDLLPYLGAWCSWVALASWQIGGIPYADRG